MFVLSYQLKNRRTLIFLNAGSRILYVAQYICLGALEGALLDIVAFFVSFLCAKRSSGFVKKYLIPVFVFSNVLIVASDKPAAHPGRDF